LALLVIVTVTVTVRVAFVPMKSGAGDSDEAGFPDDVVMMSEAGVID
jgi:hypothetical protein